MARSGLAARGLAARGPRGWAVSSVATLILANAAVACGEGGAPGGDTGGAGAGASVGTGGHGEGASNTGGTGSTAGGGAGATGGSVDVDAPFDLTIEEDSAAVCGHLAEVTTAVSGYGGPGYLESPGLHGVGVSWIVTVPAAGDYDLGLRYLNDDDARSARLRVDHEDGELLDLVDTAGEFAIHGARVTLDAGVHHVSVVGEGASGLVSVDALLVRGTGVAAGDCLEYAPGAGITYQEPSFQDQSVHDPSVIEANGTYYVFGSHLAAAKTGNWMSWSLIAGDGVNANNPLFDDVTVELADAFEYSTVVGLWAADVLELRSTGDFLMYYNSCQGSSPRSAMGIASSSDIEGPYEDEGIFMYSGGSGYDASVLPNAIDPDAFYDPDGNLWLAYGSYSGGIYVLPLDETTGFPEEDGEFGTHILGGNHIQIEGAFIQRSEETGYYYLFTSYGGLAAGDGYNMRIARATEPDGPYFDHANVNQATITSAPYDTSGVKLMGDHLWTHLGGNNGYVSPGHNSTHFDAETGQYFLIFHARFPTQGNFHQIRVHEMYLNLDGWFVAAPLRYAPRIPVGGAASPSYDYVGLSEIPGDYQFIDHGRAISGTIQNSVSVTLDADGNVSGALDGTWRFGGNAVVVLTVGGTEYRGVVTRQWSQGDDAFVVTLSGLSSGGVSLWGLRTGD